MKEYRIEKDPHPVMLTLLGGELISGAMFVLAHARRRSGREDPADILNEPEPFFPFLTDAQETLLIPKARVLEVAGDIPSCQPAALAVGNPVVRISITLVGGTVRNGTVFLETAGLAPRPLDFLNHTTQRFFALHAADAVRLINRDLIERVHPLD